MTANIQQEVMSTIATRARIDVATITPQSTLASLGVASLEAIEIIFEIEETFDITLPEDSTALKTETVQGLIEAVQRALADKTKKPGDS